MSQYIDAIVIPVPRANLDTYKRMSKEWGDAHVSRGALYYSDSISDDVEPGKVTSFPQAVQLKDSEVIALAWVVYRSKEDRDRISKAVMDDPKLKESMNPSKMPSMASACSGVASRRSSGPRGGRYAPEAQCCERRGAERKVAPPALLAAPSPPPLRALPTTHAK
jgi:uncharacterized protein YbaA (DUF1428 family)